MTSSTRARQQFSAGRERVGLSLVEALVSRRSVRAYLPDEVPEPIIERLLELAAASASNSNCQPWQVHVLTGEAKAQLSSALLVAVQRGDRVDESELEYPYQPAPGDWVDPFKSRRKQFGEGLYRDALGIEAADIETRESWRGRNYTFFDAPVGLMVTVSRTPLASALVDAGIYLQSLMLAARSFGLDTCPQATFLNYHPIIRGHLGIPSDQLLVCGMSLGYIDAAHPINANRTSRLPVHEFVTFHR